MSPFSAALDHLARAIDSLEKAVDARVTRLEQQQRDLFATIDAQRDQSGQMTRELDEIISQLETTLDAASASAASDNTVQNA